MFVFGGFDGGSTGDDFRFSRDGNLISIRGADPDDTVGYLGNETGLYMLGWRLQNGEVTNTSLSALEPIPATTDDAFPGQATTDSELIRLCRSRNRPPRRRSSISTPLATAIR